MPKKPLNNDAGAIRLRVAIADLNAHLFGVSMLIARPAAQQQLSLPVWIPGSYLVREFSKNLQRLRARQRGRTVPLVQIDKCSWAASCSPEHALELDYEVYANDNSVRTAWLDAARGFFNGTSLCLRVAGQEDTAHVLEVVEHKATPGWHVATGLAAQKVNKRGFGIYRASNYDELADCPVEMGTFWRGEFKAQGVPHRFIVAGAAPNFDGARLLADTKKICEAEIRFWHREGASVPARRAKSPPHKDYLFMLNAVDDGYGGLEHRNSTALICNRRDLPRIGEAKTAEGYTTLQGLISHEYFHTWNVKRLRPAEFARYAYGTENYTELLWFFEGFTSYYDDLLLCRAGLLDAPAYLKLLNRTINQVLQSPGREVQSVAQASFDAWVKYYRQDENTPNATVSYYTKGALVALCFDLTLRREGRTTLDDVMRALWLRCEAGPMSEADFAAVLGELGGRSFAKEIAAWVHSIKPLPLQDLLQHHGVAVLEEPAQLAQRLGLRVAESHTGIQLKTVLRGGAAERAGMVAGDEWIGIEVEGTGWRMLKLDDMSNYAAPGAKVTALVARDKRLLRLPLGIPATATTWRLAALDAERLRSWLHV